MELTLGPILFEWKRDEVLSFYEKVAEIDVICGPNITS